MYTVVWTQDALNQLARTWQSADTQLRQQITTATQLFDDHLKINAPRLGESREKNRRVVFVEPLGFNFQVSEADRLATVIRVWAIRERN